MVKTSLLVLLALPLVSARMRGAITEADEKFPITRQLMVGGGGGMGGDSPDTSTDSVEFNYDSEDVPMMGSTKMGKKGGIFKGDKKSSKKGGKGGDNDDSSKDSKKSKKSSKKGGKSDKKSSKKGGKDKKPEVSDDYAHQKGSRK
jgi:hypothetical protein